MKRNEVEDIWCDARIAISKRHSPRLIKEGITSGYWTLDTRTRRIYLSGHLRVAKQLVKYAIDAGYSHIIETNEPGKRRVEVDLSGGIQEASAQLHAAWMGTKDSEKEGMIISRVMLCALWDVSIPTLLKWEEIAHIGKRANYAQQSDTSIPHVPAHTYLTLNRDGLHSAAWRLPNTYTTTEKSIQQHPHFYVGKRHSVTIFEPYNPVTNMPETCLNQRLIWMESNNQFERSRSTTDKL